MRYQKAIQAAERVFKEQQVSAEEIQQRAAKLMEMSASQRRLVLLNSAPCRPLVSSLLPTCTRLPAAAALDLAEALLESAAAIPSADSLTLEALVEVANSRRRLGDLGGAEKLITAVRRALIYTPVDPLVEARIYAVAASLAHNLRETRRALRRARKAYRIYRDIGQRDLECDLLTLMALLHGDSEAPESGLVVAHSAVRLAEDLGDPLRAVGAVNNVIYLLVELKLWEPASHYLSIAEPLYRSKGTPRNRTQGAWLRCRIAHGLGDLDVALEGLQAVSERLAGEGAAWEYAIARLHLSLVHADAGRWDRITPIALDLLPLLEAMGASTTALATIRLCAEARKRELVVEAIQAARTTPIRPVQPFGS